MTAFRPLACGDVGPAIQELKKPGSEDPSYTTSGDAISSAVEFVRRLTSA